MPSSTSSSEPRYDPRLYDRTLPGRSLGPAAIVAVAVMLFGMGAWEMYWRANDAVPSYRNSAGLWAIQRRRIDEDEGDSTVITGSSRMLFNMQLHVWEEESGERPIQLALEGTSPIPLMEDLASNANFTGTLIVGIAPAPFFGGNYRSDVIGYHQKESPSQWLGQRISMVMEPYLAFYHFDYSLFTILKRQALPTREGVTIVSDVRRLSTHERDRATRMFRKVETDPAYAEIAKQIWAQNFVPIEEHDEDWLAQFNERRKRQIERAVAATLTLQDRGVEVIFVRSPAAGHYEIMEPMYFPREQNWDTILERTGALGIHWLDHEALQGYWLPEWSHLSGREADRFTRALYHVVQTERAARNATELSHGD